MSRANSSSEWTESPLTDEEAKTMMEEMGERTEESSLNSLIPNIPTDTIQPLVGSFWERLTTLNLSEPESRQRLGQSFLQIIATVSELMLMDLSNAVLAGREEERNLAVSEEAVSKAMLHGLLESFETASGATHLTENDLFGQVIHEVTDRINSVLSHSSVQEDCLVVAEDVSYRLPKDKMKNMFRNAKAMMTSIKAKLSQSRRGCVQAEMSPSHTETPDPPAPRKTVDSTPQKHPLSRPCLGKQTPSDQVPNGNSSSVTSSVTEMRDVLQEVRKFLEQEALYLGGKDDSTVSRDSNSAATFIIDAIQNDSLTEGESHISLPWMERVRQKMKHFYVKIYARETLRKSLTRLCCWCGRTDDVDEELLEDTTSYVEQLIHERAEEIHTYQQMILCMGDGEHRALCDNLSEFLSVRLETPQQDTQSIKAECSWVMGEIYSWIQTQIQLPVRRAMGRIRSIVFGSRFRADQPTSTDSIATGYASSTSQSTTEESSGAARCCINPQGVVQIMKKILKQEAVELSNSDKSSLNRDSQTTASSIIEAIQNQSVSFEEKKKSIVQNIQSFFVRCYTKGMFRICLRRLSGESRMSDASEGSVSEDLSDSLYEFTQQYPQQSDYYQRLLMCMGDASFAQQNEELSEYLSVSLDPQQERKHFLQDIRAEVSKVTEQIRNWIQTQVQLPALINPVQRTLGRIRRLFNNPQLQSVSSDTTLYPLSTVSTGRMSRSSGTYPVSEVSSADRPCINRKEAMDERELSEQEFVKLSSVVKKQTPNTVLVEAGAFTPAEVKAPSVQQDAQEHSKEMPECKASVCFGLAYEVAKRISKREKGPERQALTGNLYQQLKSQAPQWDVPMNLNLKQINKVADEVYKDLKKGTSGKHLAFRAGLDPSFTSLVIDSIHQHLIMPPREKCTLWSYLQSKWRNICCR